MSDDSEKSIHLYQVKEAVEYFSVTVPIPPNVKKDSLSVSQRTAIRTEDGQIFINAEFFHQHKTLVNMTGQENVLVVWDPTFEWPFIPVKWLMERFPQPHVIELCEAVIKRVDESYQDYLEEEARSKRNVH